MHKINCILCASKCDGRKGLCRNIQQCKIGQVIATNRYGINTFGIFALVHNVCFCMVHVHAHGRYSFGSFVYLSFFIILRRLFLYVYRNSSLLTSFQSVAAPIRFINIDIENHQVMNVATDKPKNVAKTQNITDFWRQQ